MSKIPWWLIPPTWIMFIYGLLTSPSKMNPWATGSSEPVGVYNNIRSVHGTEAQNLSLSR
jgi:hypothetical protein